MKLLFCVICGTNKNLHHHHVIPKVSGGTDHQHNLITVCGEHHAFIHSLRPSFWNNHQELMKIGREKAKKAGVKFGRKNSYTPQQEEEVMKLRKQNKGYKTIAKETNIHKSTVVRIIKRSGTK